MTSPLTLQHFLVVAAILFSLGIACVVTRRNAVAVLIGIELLLNAAGLNLVAFARFGAAGGAAMGSVFVLFVIVLAAAEAVVALALILAIHRRLKSVELDRTDSLLG